MPFLLFIFFFLNSFSHFSLSCFCYFDFGWERKKKFIFRDERGSSSSSFSVVSSSRLKDEKYLKGREYSGPYGKRTSFRAIDTSKQHGGGGWKRKYQEKSAQ
jgi:hypothetical protein